MSTNQGFDMPKKNPILQQLRMQNIFKKRSEIREDKANKKTNKNEKTQDDAKKDKSENKVIPIQQRLTGQPKSDIENQSRKRSIDYQDETPTQNKRFKSTKLDEVNINKSDVKTSCCDDQQIQLNNYIKRIKLKYNLSDKDILEKVETNLETLRKRQKCINYGKVTDEYKCYLQNIPKRERKSHHPRTPNKFNKCSRRKFDGLVKKWRIQLHTWDKEPNDNKYKDDDESDNDDNFMDYEDAYDEDVLIIHEDVDLTL